MIHIFHHKASLCTSYLTGMFYYYIIDRAFGSNRISRWQILKNHAKAYSRATTLHGFAYMGEADRNWKEK